MLEFDSMPNHYDTCESWQPSIRSAIIAPQHSYDGTRDGTGPEWLCIDLVSTSGELR